jgi:hypothetical protein
MTRDDRVLFENYRSIYLTEEDKSKLPGPTPSGSPVPPTGSQKPPGTEDWENAKSAMWFVAQVIDPTGVLSYGDLIKQAQKWNNDPSYINTILLGICIYCALPNFGLAAAVAGGITWSAIKAGLKAAVTAAAKKGSYDALLSEFNMVVKQVQTSANAVKFVTKTLDMLLKRGAIDKAGYDNLKHALTNRAAKLENDVYKGNLENNLKAANYNNVPDTATGLYNAGKEFINPATNAGQRIRSGAGIGTTDIINDNPKVAGLAGYRKQISLSDFENKNKQPFKVGGKTPKVGEIVLDKDGVKFLIIP